MLHFCPTANLTAGLHAGEHYLGPGLDVKGLYEWGSGSRYWYFGGVRWLAVAAVIVGAAPCIPGFVEAVIEGGSGDDCSGSTSAWTMLYDLAWFVAGIVATGSLRPAPAQRSPGPLQTPFSHLKVCLYLVSDAELAPNSPRV